MYAGVEWSEDIDSFPDYAIINYSLDGGHTQKKMTSTIIHGTAEIYSPDGAVRAMLDLSESSPKLILFNRLTNEPLKNPGPFDFFECK